MVLKFAAGTFVSCFFFSCTANKIYTQIFASEQELITYAKEHFKKYNCNSKDSVYYLPPIASKILSDTTIILFASNRRGYKPCGEYEYYYSRKQLRIIVAFEGQ